MLEYGALSLFVVYAVAVNVQLFLLKRSINSLSQPVVSTPPKQKVLVSSKRVLNY